MTYKYEVREEDGYYSIYVYDSAVDPFNEDGVLAASGLFVDEVRTITEGIRTAFYAIAEMENKK